MDKLNNAVKIFGLENGQYNLDDIKKIYRQLASKNHPDKGGDTETMQLINTAFEELCKYFAEHDTLDINQDESEAQHINFEFIRTLKAMLGIIIEICGYWVWLSGNTYVYREAISELGFKYSGAKKMWYWSPTIDITKFKRGCKSMKKIRKDYGSMIIDTENQKALN